MNIAAALGTKQRLVPAVSHLREKIAAHAEQLKGRFARGARVFRGLRRRRCSFDPSRSLGAARSQPWHADPEDCLANAAKV